MYDYCESTKISAIKIDVNQSDLSLSYDIVNRFTCMSFYGEEI
jgi:hypothetical protein